MTTNNPNNSKSRKRANIREVAKLAGVSVATVSYVINERNDQHISEATRKKVIQAINYLNYTPNPYAVDLNYNYINSIVVRTPQNASVLQEMETLFLMRDLHEICLNNGLNIIYSQDKRNVKISSAACICVGMSKSDFHSFASENYVPVVAVDSLIDDPFFYQVSTNYLRLKEKACDYFGDKDFVYLAILPQNEKLKQSILSVLPNTLFINEISNLKDYLPHLKNVVVSQKAVSQLLNSVIERINLFDYTNFLQEKPSAIFGAIRHAIERTQISNQDHFIEI